MGKKQRAVTGELRRVGSSLAALQVGYRHDAPQLPRTLAVANLVEAVTLGAFAGAEFAELRHLIRIAERFEARHTSLDFDDDGASDADGSTALHPLYAILGWIIRRGRAPTWFEAPNTHYYFPEGFAVLAELIEASGRATNACLNEGLGADLNKESLVIALLYRHPEWSDKRIAKAAGCSRGSLYRWEAYVNARSIMKSAKRKFAKGIRQQGGGIADAWRAEDVERDEFD